MTIAVRNVYVRDRYWLIIEAADGHEWSIDPSILVTIGGQATASRESVSLWFDGWGGSRSVVADTIDDDNGRLKSVDFHLSNT